MQSQRTSTVILHDPPDADAQAFIDHHGLQPWIDEACHLITGSLDLAAPTTVEKHSDPELTDEWITLRFLARGEIEDVLDAYDQITRRMVEILPLGAARKLRLTVGLA